MRMDTAYRPGPRAYRTAAAVFLCLCLTSLLGRPSPFYGAIAAVICTQSTGEKTRSSGLHRLLGTVIGGGLGFVFLELAIVLPNFEDLLYILLIPPAVLGAIYLCNLFQRAESVSICCVVLLNVATNFDRDIPDTALYVFNRVLDTGLGILSAVAVTQLEELVHKFLNGLGPRE